MSIIGFSAIVSLALTATPTGGFNLFPSLPSHRADFAEPPVKITSALQQTANDDGAGHDSSFEEFAKRNQLRSWLSTCEALSSLSDIQLEVMTQSMKERELTKGQDLLRGGEDATEWFMVSDGMFESYEYNKKDKEVVLFGYKPGDAVGAISYASKNQYLYSVRSTTDEASAWHIDNKSLDEIFNAKKDLVAGSILAKYTREESQFSGYLNDFLDRSSALKSFGLFRKNLNKKEIGQLSQLLTERSFASGEDVVTAGDSDTDMYFIRDGSFEAYNADGKVVMSYPNEASMSYFGELSFLLQRPRTISVRVSSPQGTLYSLSREDLYNVVDEDTFKDDALALLAEQYKDAGFLDTYNELLEYLAVKSRPKKKPVSLHSTVSIVSAGAYVSAYQPFFHVGTDKDGFIAFFDFYGPLSVGNCHQIQLGVVLLAISGIMGYFRIPPNAPAARRLPFTLATLSNTFFALVLTSSLNALPIGYWQFDAFSPLGKVAIGLAFFIEEYFSVSALCNALCGSEDGMSSTPGAIGRASNIFFATLIYLFVTSAQAPLVIPIFFSDLTSYQDSMSAAFQSVDLPALNFHSFATAVGFVSFLQLVATLQFEKKLSEMQGSIALVSLFIAFNCDAISATYKTLFRPDLLPLIEKSNNYLPGLIGQNFITEIVVGLTSMVFLNAAWTIYSKEKME
eukprot:CAMPEP_0172530778 /NCGR_PEP_ID=MMETSP1067-20121228/4402_1 /TAXON_ID=265564 ORGANISM="Thalassiosira punctigera, Strain Tpunct2005C2" /NCGR_SAMPLE_ID=MMETSP1067 /ASSEMBLY_ACC=CAM_ASM_000444 /LENGTH=680 /DNA_ID=CAMNT_0013315039 /DNA_START=170 /DNA_END=2212 /DNA_ORIENTATION=-